MAFDAAQAWLGRKTLLVNPPLVNGVAFTRQGRCQEREEVLGTTKPPYTLALLATLLRDAGCEVRLVDLTAERRSVEDLVAQLDREKFHPTLILFPSTTPTLDADVSELAKLKAHFGAPIFCFGPHASTTPRASMLRSPQVDGMFVGEPEDGTLQLARLESVDQLASVPSLTWRRGDQVVPHTAQGTYGDFAQMPYPAWDLVPLKSSSLPPWIRPFVFVETSRGCA